MVPLRLQLAIAGKDVSTTPVDWLTDAKLILVIKRTLGGTTG